MPNRAAKRLVVRPKDRRALVELTRKLTAPQRSVLRARVVLDAANGLSHAEIARRTGISANSVFSIRDRFSSVGIASVLADAARSGRPKVIPGKTIESLT